MFHQFFNTASKTDGMVAVSTIMKHCLCDAVVRHQIALHLQLQPWWYVGDPSPRPTAFQANDLGLPNWWIKMHQPFIPFCLPAEAFYRDAATAVPNSSLGARSESWVSVEDQCSCSSQVLLPQGLQGATTSLTPWTPHNLTLHSDLDRKCSNPFFFKYFDQTSPHCHLDLEDSYLVSLLVLWAQSLEDSKQFFSAWLSGSWCCITIPNLVTKWSAVQKISSKQTFKAFWIFVVTLNAAIPFFHRTPQLTNL